MTPADEEKYKERSSSTSHHARASRHPTLADASGSTADDGGAFSCETLMGTLGDGPPQTEGGLDQAPAGCSHCDGGDADRRSTAGGLGCDAETVGEAAAACLSSPLGAVSLSHATPCDHTRWLTPISRSEPGRVSYEPLGGPAKTRRLRETMPFDSTAGGESNRKRSGGTSAIEGALASP